MQVTLTFKSRVKVHINQKISVAFFHMFILLWRTIQSLLKCRYIYLIGIPGLNVHLWNIGDHIFCICSSLVFVVLFFLWGVDGKKKIIL